MKLTHSFNALDISGSNEVIGSKKVEGNNQWDHDDENVRRTDNADYHCTQRH